MKSKFGLLSVLVMSAGILGASGCKATCEKAVANLRELAKQDADFQKRIANEKDEELIAECKKGEEKKPGSVECVVNAKTLDELKNCK